jgi:hypothetical protein
MQRIYLEAGYKDVLKKSGLNDKELYFFRFPEENANQLKIAHWSYFEDWDPYRNYLIAKEHCGLRENEGTNSGTFTNFSQNDQALYVLHTYIMYLKFGFGRANQDASIEIRRGAMHRDQAINLVRLYDGHYPDEFISTYLEYYRMNIAEFNTILDHWVNKNLFAKSENRWQPLFTIK